MSRSRLLTETWQHAKRSLVWRLTALVLCSTFIVWLFFSIILVWQANQMTRDILERQHTQFIEMLWDNLGDEDDLKAHHIHPFGSEHGLEFALYNITTNELINASSSPALPMQRNLSAQTHDKPITLDMGHHHEWMLSSRQNEQVQLVIASPIRLTHDLSHELAERIGLIALLGLLLLCIVLYWALRRGMLPIKQFTAHVATRASDNLAPINIEMLDELDPLRNRLNVLFEQVEQTLARETRFTADAAHELRTPLAAVKLQIELAQNSTRAEIRSKALNHASTAIDRATHVVTQLLLLARLEHGQAPETEHIDLASIAHNALTEANLPTDAKHLQIKAPCAIAGQPLLLMILLRNLIDNALRYGGDNTQVFIIITAHGFTLTDNGKGMDESTRKRLGERFYRPVGQDAGGAGLGWSIINRVAKLMHASIKTFAIQPQGFGVTVTFLQMSVNTVSTSSV